MRMSLASTLALLVVAGCEGVACGPGTELVDGECVPEEGGGGSGDGEDFCGENTEFVDGECVPDETSVGECGEGTELVDGECVSTVVEIECAEGTTLVDGECVPDATLAECGPGTELVGDECVSTIDCAPGTILSGTECVLDCPSPQVAQDGACLDPAEVDASNPDVTETEPNDPAYGGTPAVATIPPVGNSVVITGAIDPPTDLDGDTILDQDWDVVDFTVAPGDVVQVTLTPLNGADIGFSLRLGSDSYLRYAPAWVQTSPQREFVITQGGTYSLEIAPTGQIQGFPLGPVGGPGWDYVVTLERRTFPVSQPLALDTEASGDLLDSANNLYQIEAAAGSPTRVEVTTGPHANAVVTSVDSSGNVRDLGSGSTLTYTPTADDDFYVFVDFFSLTGADDDYTIIAETDLGIDLGDVPSGGNLQAGPYPGYSWLTQSYTFDAEAGEMLDVFVDQGSFEPPDIDVYDPNGVLVFSPSGEPGGPPPIYAETAGSWQLDVSPNGDGPLHFDIRSRSVIDLGSVDTTSTTSAQDTVSSFLAFDSQWYTVTASEDLALELSVGQSSSNFLYLFAFDQQMEPVDSAFATTNPRVTVPSVPGGERVFFEVGNDESFDASDVVVQAQVVPPPPVEVEPNPNSNPQVLPDDTTQVLGSISDGDSDWFTYTSTTGGLHRLSLVGDIGPGGPFYLEVHAGGELIETVSTFEPELAIVFEAGRAYQIGIFSESEPFTRNWTLDILRVAPEHHDEVEDNGDPTDPPLPVALTGVGADTQSVVGTLTGSADTQDCYTLLPPSNDDYTIDLAGVDVGRGSQFLSPAVTVAFYQLDGTTPIMPNGNTISLTTQPAFACISGYGAGGNTYRFQLRGPGVPGPSIGSPFANTVIPDGDSTGIEVQGFLDTPCTVADVNVDVDVTHPQPLDLQVELESPGGSTFVLKYPGTYGGTDHIGNYPIDFSPADDWSSLVGSEASGLWRMRFIDGFTPDEGTLNSWRVNFSCF